MWFRRYHKSQTRGRYEATRHFPQSTVSNTRPGDTNKVAIWLALFERRFVQVRHLRGGARALEEELDNSVGETSVRA